MNNARSSISFGDPFNTGGYNNKQKDKKPSETNKYLSKYYLNPRSHWLCPPDYERDGPVVCTGLLTLLSIMLVVVTLPLSLVLVVKVVQEFERAVIFRLGRLLAGGARGPGVFFVVPCVDR